MEFLRNQEAGKEHNLCLSDYIAPAVSGVTDYMGLFALTAGLGIEQRVKAFEQQNDDYSAIMLKLLADRLAEAMAEMLHYRIRKEFWGYAPAEEYDTRAFLKENYRGIRPAAGYPACPDHSEKTKIFDLLRATEECGITLTENYAMYPTAAVSGYYFAHPKAKYFNVGKIDDSQLRDYQKRKNLTREAVRRLLSQNINE